jgi:tetratricopeptide (TPR) repeat protein
MTISADRPAGARPVLVDAFGRPYEPAVSPRLKVLLFVIFLATALLGLSGVYLLAIDGLEWFRGQTYVNQFYLWMFLAHVAVGVVIALPFLFFGVSHYLSARHRKNRRAVRLGLSLFLAGILVVLTGLALVQLEGLPQLPTGSVARWLVWGLHVLVPGVAVFLYIQHRRAGPDIQWRYGYGWGAAVAAFVGVMFYLHSQDPRKWGQVGPKEGAFYFEPSKLRTPTGHFIPAQAMMMDEYCKKCHPDIYNEHFHSAHKFSSFNNPPYLFSVRETRKVGMKRDGHPRGSRWCAGCHDVVPFVSGAFDDPDFDDVNHPTAHAGITCTACHAITHVNSPEGNADYTIEEPIHYPFAYSDNPFLQWVNNQLVKAKPDFHKKTFLKPLHRSAGNDKSSLFCSTCHKVSIPVELTHYKEFLRGQNHYDSYLLSGVSGVGARSFYYPPKVKTSCQECHMPLKESDDFGSKDFDGSGVRKVHSHLFPAANTGLPFLLTREDRYKQHADGFLKAMQAHADFLRGTAPDGSDRKLRVDIFGIKAGDDIDAPLVAPIRPKLPALKPGRRYLVEVVVRTVNLGHPFTQGTSDSNEVWVDFTARSGDRVIGRSGELKGKDDSGPLDPWAHRINVLMLDRHGNRIDRRNPQDIFTPLYNHQIPPGAAQVVHYLLEVPKDVKGPVELSVRVRYRKFDFEYLSLVYGGADKVPKLPVVDLCEDKVTLPVEGGGKVPEQVSPIKPAWQRWNDYGIGCLIEGGPGEKKGELRQAERAFQQLTKADMPEEAHSHGYLNMARVYVEEGRLAEATRALNRSRECEPKAPWWTVSWFSGLVNAENARDARGFDSAIADFERILDPENQPRDKKFDFRRDYVVINKLAQTLFKRSQFEAQPARRDPFLLRAVEQYERTLAIDPEDLDAHYGLYQCHSLLGRAMPRVTVPAGFDPDTREDALVALSATLRDAGRAKEDRLKAAAELARAITKLDQEESKAWQGKRPRLDTLLAQLRPYFREEKDSELKAAASYVLARLHRGMHALLKPDELARGRATRAYRATHPAANHAAEAIVIYPTTPEARRELER